MRLNYPAGKEREETGLKTSVCHRQSIGFIEEIKMLHFCCSPCINRDGLMLIFDSNLCVHKRTRLFLMMFAQEHFTVMLLFVACCENKS